MTDEDTPGVYTPVDGDHGDHQLKPVTGGRYQQVFKGHDDVGDLAVDIEPVGGEGGRILVTVHSGWLPTGDQVKQLEAGAHVRLTLWMYPIPPVAVCLEPPVCACHGAPMRWDADDEGYYCLNQKQADDWQAVPADESPLDAARRSFTPESSDEDAGGDDVAEEV